jgi:uncharacterized protein
MNDATLTEQLRAILHSEAHTIALLSAVAERGPPGAFVAAGAIRDTVWSHLTGRRNVHTHADVDVIHFAPDEPLSAARNHEGRLKDLRPDIHWEVTNQALVHLWYATETGAHVEPLQSLEDAMATWPETATAVAARIAPGGEIEILAPLGLADLFGLVLRHNTRRTGRATFEQRVATKGWLVRWPELRLAR